MASHTDVPSTDSRRGKSDFRSPHPNSSDVDKRPQKPMTKLPPNQLGLALLLAVSMMVGWRPLVDTFALALRGYEYTHILLILPISAALILLEWRSLKPMVARNVRAGSALLAIGVMVRRKRRG